MKFLRPAVGFAAFLSAATLAAPVALAFDPIEFEVTEDTEDLANTLRSASLLLATQAEGKTSPEDIMAAARAEYGQLVNALYAAGHYSPVITVLIDGREAAAIRRWIFPAA